MKRIEIRTPIWNGRCIGVGEYHFNRFNDSIKIEITYKDKQGNQLYPDIYILSWSQAQRYPVQRVKGIYLRIIPIGELEIKGSVAV